MVEVMVKKKYDKLCYEVKKFISNEDSLKIYKIIGKGQVTSYGKNIDYETEDVIII